MPGTSKTGVVRTKTSQTHLNADSSTPKDQLLRTLKNLKLGKQAFNVKLAYVSPQNKIETKTAANEYRKLEDVFRLKRNASSRSFLKT